jgi:hypothetical protein
MAECKRSAVTVPTVSGLPYKTQVSAVSKVGADTDPEWSVLPNNSLKPDRNTPFILSRTIDIHSGGEVYMSNSTG